MQQSLIDFPLSSFLSRSARRPLAGPPELHPGCLLPSVCRELCWARSVARTRTDVHSQIGNEQPVRFDSAVGPGMQCERRTEESSETQE